MATVSSRRFLLGATTSAIMGSGIAAGAAASVADLVPPSDDADLIRLCSEFARLEMRRKAIYDGPFPIMDDDEAEAAAAELYDQMDSILDGIETMRAVTAQGIVALVQALHAENGDFGCSFDYPKTVPRRLLTCLFRDVAAVAGRA